MEKISEIALFQQSETYALVVETRTTVKEIDDYRQKLYGNRNIV